MLTHNGNPRGDQNSILNYVKWIIARHLEDMSMKANDHFLQRNPTMKGKGQGAYMK